MKDNSVLLNRFKIRCWLLAYWKLEEVENDKVMTNFNLLTLAFIMGVRGCYWQISADQKLQVAGYKLPVAFVLKFPKQNVTEP